jgi:hypothetical protein
MATNTCKPSSLHKRLSKQLEGIERHLEDYPNDRQSLERVAKIKAILASN